MSNWTKGFIGVAIASQIALFVLLFDCKIGDAFYISSNELFSMALCSICTITYIFVSIVSHDSDKIRKKLDEQLQA
jgi:hypothetical protein